MARSYYDMIAEQERLKRVREGKPPRRPFDWKPWLFAVAVLLPGLAAAGLAILLVIVAVGWFIVWLAGWRVY